MKEINVLEDLSRLTQIPTSILSNISETLHKEIGHIVYEEFVLSQREEVEIDVGIGIITIYKQYDGNEEFLSYDFKPSKKLEKVLIESLADEESPLINQIEKNLKNKILSLYKDLV